MTGLRGPVDRCEAGRLHDHAPYPLRPPAVYLFYPLPCENERCTGRLVCIGHAVCAECAAAIRAGRTEWTDTGNDVDVVLIHGAKAAS